MINKAELESAANQPEPWTRVHRRVWDHPGAIVDLGCLSWNWSKRFFGKKRVLGVDPFETETPAGAELWQGVIAASTGAAWISDSGHGSTTRGAKEATVADLVPARPLEEVLRLYNITDISVLKLNVEGAELEILMTMPERLFDHIDQIAVSFHDFLTGEHRKTEALLVYLCNWYELVPIESLYGWYLGVRRR
jgi:hypothetical protein